MSLPEGLWNIVLEYVDDATLLRLRTLPRYRQPGTKALLRRDRVQVLLSLPHVQKKFGTGPNSLDWVPWIKHSTLNDDFVEKYHRKWKGYAWDAVRDNPHLTPEIVVKHMKEIDSCLGGTSVCTWMPLTPSTVAARGNKMDWRALVSRNPHVTVSFLEKYEPEIDWEAAACNRHLPLEAWTRWSTRLPIQYLSLNIHLTPELIERYSEELHWIDIIDRPVSVHLLRKYQHKIRWDVLSRKSHLTEEVIDAFADKFDWKDLSRGHCLTPSLIEKYHDRVDWDCWNGFHYVLTPALIEKYCDRLYWPSVSRYSPLTMEIIERYQDKISWVGLSLNYFLDVSMIDRWSEKWSAIKHEHTGTVWRYISAGHFLRRREPDDEPKVVALITKYRTQWTWKDLSYACLEHRWELIVDHPEWPWCW